MKETAVLLLHLVTFVLLIQTEGTQTQIRTKCLLADSKCLTRQAQNTLQTFSMNGKGIPELGDLKMDKLHVDHVTNDVDNFNFNWTDVMVGGLQNSVIDDLTIHIMQFKTIRLLFHTNLSMEFNYVMDGVVLSIFPVFGTGKGELKLKNMIMEMLFMFDIVKDDNGKDIMDLKKYYYGFETIDGIEAYFDNLYDGDKKKSDIFHNIANESWMIMKANFGKSFQRKISSKIFEAAKIYMRAHPLEEFALY